MERTVLRMLDEAAVKYRDDPYALRKGDSGYLPVTFHEARERAREFAAWLIGKGFLKDEALAVLGEGCPEWIIGEFGLIMAGCVSVPLSIKLLEEEIPFRLNHAECRAILTTKNQLEKVLASFKAVDNKAILVVYLDDDADEARLVAARHGLAGERIVGLAEALVQGRAALDAPDGKTLAELDRRAAAAREDDTVTICYTSGTTGNPKGIMLTHLNYYTNCYDGIELFEGPYHFRTLLILPVDHSFAHTVGIYAALVCGISLYFVDSRGGGIATLRNIPINLRESKPIFLLTVPALSGNFMKKIISGVEEKGGLIEKIFKAGIQAGIAYNGNGYNRPPLGTRLRNFLTWKFAKALIFNKIRKMIFGESARFCVGGGALLDVKQQEFFAAFGLPVFQGYGLTEAAPVISSNTPSRHKFGTSGIVAPSVECTIRHADGSLCAVGETGEIVIRGGNVMKGYFKNPEASAQSLRDGWLWTGDLAYYDADGFLVVVGREKALLIAEDGEKYSPEDIEEAVTFSTDVIDQIMVYCDHRKYTTAFVTLDEAKVKRLIKEKGITTSKALLEALKAEFYAFRADPKAKKVQANWVPAAFHVVPEAFNDRNGTVNSTMKIVRHRIGVVYKDLIDYAYTSEGSRTENPRNLDTLGRIFKL